MLRVGFALIRPEKESRLRAWLTELGTREAEVIESFLRETTRHEQAFIMPSEAGPVLVYAMEVEDPVFAAAAYKDSSLSIDIEHRAVLEECLLERLKIEPLFDCAVKGRNEAA
jgi:Family of unknown function (DUF6176)